jgi:hypothetical protein
MGVQSYLMTGPGGFPPSLILRRQCAFGSGQVQGTTGFEFGLPAAAPQWFSITLAIDATSAFEIAGESTIDIIKHIMPIVPSKLETSFFIRLLRFKKQKTEIHTLQTLQLSLIISV